MILMVEKALLFIILGQTTFHRRSGMKAKVCSEFILGQTLVGIRLLRKDAKCVMPL